MKHKTRCKEKKPLLMRLIHRLKSSSFRRTRKSWSPVILSDWQSFKRKGIAMAVGEHKGKHLNAGCMIITISDTRTAATDKSGRLIATMLEQAGHRVEAQEIVPDESRAVQTAIEKGCDHAAIDVILTNGGTGIAARDITIETVQPMLDKEISGFGELFRMLSYAEDIGSAALMSRAGAGIKNDTANFSMPETSGAVKRELQKRSISGLLQIYYKVRKD